MKYIGLDFGTSNCCIAILDKNKKIDFIKYNNSFIIPTVINIFNKSLRFGNFNDGINICNLKRLIGHKYNTISNFNLFPFEITNDNNNIKIYDFTLDELLIFILTFLKNVISEYIQDEWTSIISVPAYFNECQRSYLWDILKKVDINCTKILNEPTCACISYLTDKSISRKILVFDLGGGTLDLTLMNIEEEFYEVENIYGNNNLGGIDITNEISIKYNIDYNKAEQLKLNNNDITISDNLKNKIIFTLDKIITNKDDIDFILLVGGSSKMKIIKTIVKDYLNKIIEIPPIIIDNTPLDFEDISVAYGAALYNYNINCKTSKDIILLDRLPISIGVDTNGIFTPIVSRNSVIPLTITKSFTTDKDYETSININILQGEEYFSKDNLLIGSFELVDITPLLKGVPVIYITIHININGIIEVSAKERRGDNNTTIKINALDISNNSISKIEINNDITIHNLFDKYQYLLNLLNQLPNIKEKESILNELDNIKKYLKIYNVSLGFDLIDINKNTNTNLKNDDIETLINKIDKYISDIKLKLKNNM